MRQEGPLQCVGGDGERTSWWAMVGSVGDRVRSPSPIDFHLDVTGFGHQNPHPGCKIISAQPLGTGSFPKS